jgi:HAD superfamily hydrolase (TIGR01509 family)
VERIKGKIKAIIFDMDGTIINTEHIWRQVTIDVLTHHGLDSLTKEQYAFLETLAGRSMYDVVKALKEYFKLDSTHEMIIAHKIDLANKQFASNLHFIEGFQDFHKKLQEAKIPMGLATNAIPENLNEIARRLNFEELFNGHVYSIANVGYKAKPDPTLFLYAAEKLGVSASECVVFEDSLAGFMAAKAANMTCIAIKNRFNGHLLEHVHDSIGNYDEATEMLAKIADYIITKSKK